ncbi:MAG: type II toxin-antitoxin system HicB family antitoxin [Chitinophagales bacterium]
MKKINVIIEKTRTGYSAYTEVEPVATTGKTIEKIKANMLEALNLYFEDMGITISEKHITFSLDLPQFIRILPGC